MVFFLISEIGNPIRIILKLNGNAKAIHYSLEGLYILDTHKKNGKPIWRNGEADLWYAYDKNGSNWTIGTGYGSPIAMYSPDDTAGPLENNSWAYYNSSDFIFSADISLKGNMMNKIALISSKNKTT